jgi:hypothetical protein
MNFKTFKTLAIAALALAGVALMPGQANAQSNVATVTADITTDAGIDALAGVNMDFGNWLIGVHAGDTPQVIMTTAGVMTTANVGTSQLIHLDGTNTGTPGTVTVDLPTGADGIVLQMTRDGGTQVAFSDPNIVLEDITYLTATEAEAALDDATPVPVTVVTGGTPETVSFGGTVTASDTPADTAHTATFDVTFGY